MVKVFNNHFRVSVGDAKNFKSSFLELAWEKGFKTTAEYMSHSPSLHFLDSLEGKEPQMI